MAGRRYKPMRPRMSVTLPIGRDWVYELKFDGYRMLAYVTPERVSLVSKGGVECSEQYPAMVQGIRGVLRCTSCVVDGELIAVDERGYPQQSLLRRKEGTIQYCLFDLLELNGVDLTELPLMSRRKQLARILVDHTHRTIFLSPLFEDGPRLLQEACRRRLEGVVAKRRTSQYLSGRSSQSWRKIKLQYD